VLVSDEAYRRYVNINLPHARTIVQRIGRSLENLGTSVDSTDDSAVALHEAYVELEEALESFDEDPPLERALKAADAAAERGRRLVLAILGTPCRSDRLGQSVRNLFECLGLPEEGARVAIECGEREDSPLR